MHMPSVAHWPWCTYPWHHLHFLQALHDMDISENGIDRSLVCGLWTPLRLAKFILMPGIGYGAVVCSVKFTSVYILCMSQASCERASSSLMCAITWHFHKPARRSNGWHGYPQRGAESYQSIARARDHALQQASLADVTAQAAL